jgi:hypothetical protein
MITITTSRGGTGAPNSPNSFTYNIPIQHVSQLQQQQQQPQSPPPQLPNSPNRTNASYVIPVSMNLSSNNNTQLNNNYAPSSPKNMIIKPPQPSPNSAQSFFNNQNNFNLLQNYLASGGSPSKIIIKPNDLIDSTGKNLLTNENHSIIEQEVDLLKDLLVKNLNMHNNNNNKNENAVQENNAFYGICSRCNEQVIGAENGLRAMDQVFHLACFSCFSCGLNLNDEHFYAMDEQAYCENCFMVKNNIQRRKWFCN